MGLLDRMVRATVNRMITTALTEHLEKEQVDTLYRYRVHSDPSRLQIHPTAVVNNALFNTGGGTITVGEYAFFGHYVAVLAGGHDMQKFGRERQLAIPRTGHDVVIENGVWLATHVLVIGPCRIGEHAVVAGGSLVRNDVEPYTVVAGRPATVVRRLTPPPGATAPSTS
jgi:acetyltransferase-like isoleucine patch superfamily enzyme